jgi:hypothetical protein
MHTSLFSLQENTDLIVQATELDPTFKAPGLNVMGQPTAELELRGEQLWKVVKRRGDGWLEKRIPIPEKQFPGYNFKGVLIGARYVCVACVMGRDASIV